MSVFGISIEKFYKSQISQLLYQIKNPDYRKTAFAITLALCIGITPLFGLTFIMATTLGLAFRLNQVIMQSVHILVSPLQFMFFYPFIKAGKLLFSLQGGLNIPVKQVPNYIYNHTHEFIVQNLKLILAGGLVWVIFSLSMGYVVYRLVLKYFKSCCY